uniref:histidine kinase n=1 Tax=Magnetococcus massalia (strain MO-1) TaxID=451514 RepID=A0A1S7LE70_MAGMO|nr:Putative signal transduction histidine kinase [Candidatus Magnetococcus massalia]
MLTDDELIAELKERFDANKKALFDLHTVTRKLEEVNTKLASSEEVKSHFISHMKNEFNNPLSAILGISQQLASGEIEDVELLHSMGKIIYHESFSLDFQLRNIFAAAELESGDTALQMVVVDICAILKDLIDSFQHQIGEKELTLILPDSMQCGEEQPFKMDAEKFKLIASNMISNAIEFNKPGGEINLNIELSDEKLYFSIENNGPQIDPDMLAKVYDRFSQLDSGSTKAHVGHGLGLSICKALVEIMDGEIEVANCEEEGVRTAIKLPLLAIDPDGETFSLEGNDFLFDDQIEAF